MVYGYLNIFDPNQIQDQVCSREVRTVMHKCPYLFWQESLGDSLPHKRCCRGKENVISMALLHASAFKSVHFSLFTLISHSKWASAIVDAYTLMCKHHWSTHWFSLFQTQFISIYADYKKHRSNNQHQCVLSIFLVFFVIIISYLSYYSYFILIFLWLFL